VGRGKRQAVAENGEPTDNQQPTQGAKAMKGFIPKAVWAACGAAALLAGAGGCQTYKDLVDPCYPERYESMARQEVYAASAPQVANGHVLDQTIWNDYFEAGSDKLLPNGLEHLAYIARRRPKADGTVYLETAKDVAYDPGHPEKFSEARADLDAKRTVSIQRFLEAETAGRGVGFEVVVHNPGDPSISSIPASASVLKMYGGAQGVLLSAGGGGATGGGGSGH